MVIYLIYLDNAATSGKKPQNVINAVNFALNNLSANPGRAGHNRSVAASMAIYEVREKISEFFNASGPQNVVFCQNCTTALNFVIKGVLKENDHIIISDLEHNAVLRPVNKTVKDYSVATVSFFDDDETVKSFESLIKPNTKMIICTAASNVFGKILPLKKIGELCKKRDILFAVDAAQGAGVIPIDMKKMNIDFLCVAPHKGFYAPMGTGVLIAEKKISDTLVEGGNGIGSLEKIQSTDLPEGFESGTISVPNILGIGAGIDFVNNIGEEKIYEKEMRLIAFAFEGLKKNKRAILYAPYPEKNSFAPVLSFNIVSKNSEEVGAFLDKHQIACRSGFHCSFCAHNKLKTTDIGAVRISPSFFNSAGEIEYLLKTIKKI